jgi:ribosomal-protein-alanine N-acetyltransferase
MQRRTTTKTETVNIRAATAADVDSMIRIGRACPTAPQWSESQYLELFNADQPRQKLLLIIEDARDTRSETSHAVCGFLIASHVPQKNSQQEWELESIAVDPSSGRRGLGTSLLRELITHVSAQGGGSILLEVRASNTAARGLYEKCAFAHAGVRKRYYANPIEDAILYRRNV